MATTSQSPTPAPNPAPKPEADNSKQRIIAIAAVIIVALLGVNIFLLVNKAKQSRVNQEISANLDETEQLKAELEKQYYDALAELETMRGSNEELNSLIEKQKEELKSSKDQIEVLLRDKRNLAAARQKITDLSTQVEQYLAQINQLKAENEHLATTNTQLTVERDSLGNALSTQITTNEELSAARASLVSEKETLESERNNLSRKVNQASVVKVNGIDVTGLMTRSSGKKARKKYAKNVDELEVCFNTTVNEVTEPGVERFFVRIINPLGETMAVENQGSGVMTSQESGEQIRYTQVKEINYDHDAKQVCLVWAPNQPFQEGTYKVEVYNKGHLAGTTSFELK